MTQRIPKWESELWHYISSNDGTQCPLSGYRHAKQKGGWCPAACMEQVCRLVDSRYSNVEDYDSIERPTSCRIFELVEMLAQKYIKRRKVYHPPVPTELVSLADEQHPIEVRLVPLTAYHGAIWHLKGSWIIQLNENDAPATRRFTLFHEIFHILAHRKATPVFRKGELKAGHFNELLAEQFAISILMPAEMVRRKWAESNSLSKMAEIFDVPKSVACVRLKLLHLI
ncbi:MAG: ImmA/IrrE family metallo-endopeptidase [Dehalococcoidia bacterium]|nr:ImmA/IrrE family metallo-endopeptidase [Dehalococcoidia bacterium]